MSAERLQKVLASAGIASRRDCEELIVAGRIAVNGKIVRVLGSRVDLDIDTITMDGKPLEPVVQRTYIMLHKPTNVISTAEDTHDRPTVVNMVDVPARVFPVGRLDQDSEGLMLLTDDGELTQRLTHPSYEVEKEYHVLLDQPPTSDALREWREGVTIEGRRTAPAWVQTHKQTDEGTWIRIVLHEGRKRQIRMMVRSLDYAVLRLIRVREGPLSLGDLGSGEWRHLTDDEVKALWEHAGQRRFDPAKTDEAEYKPSYGSTTASTQQSSRGSTATPARERQYRQTDERRNRSSTSRIRLRQEDRPDRDQSSTDRRERPRQYTESGEQTSTHRTHRHSDPTDDRRGTRKSYKSSVDRRERPFRRREFGEQTATSETHEQLRTRDDRRKDRKSKGESQRRREDDDTRRDSSRKPARSIQESQRSQKGPQQQRSTKKRDAGKPMRGSAHTQRQKAKQRTDRPFRPKGRRKSDT